jgi:hypothetical protein
MTERIYFQSALTLWIVPKGANLWFRKVRILVPKGANVGFRKARTILVPDSANVDEFLIVRTHVMSQNVPFP